MTTLLNQNRVAVGLLAGHRLTVIVASGGDCIWSRRQGETVLEEGSVASAATKVFGEYPVDEIIHLTCNVGSLSYADSLGLGTDVTQTNDDAPANFLGEYLISTLLAASAVSETTNTPVDVTTLTLTPGDWDVSGVVNRTLGGATATRYSAAISPTADTVPAQAGGSGVAADSVVTQFATFGTTVTGGYTTVVGPVRVSIAADTVIHLVAADLFSAGTVGVCGTLRARRIR